MQQMTYHFYGTLSTYTQKEKVKKTFGTLQAYKILFLFLTQRFSHEYLYLYTTIVFKILFLEK